MLAREHVSGSTQLDHGGIHSLLPEAQVQSGGTDRRMSTLVGTCIDLETHLGLSYQPSQYLICDNCVPIVAAETVTTRAEQPN